MGARGTLEEDWDRARQLLRWLRPIEPDAAELHARGHAPRGARPAHHPLPTRPAPGEAEARGRGLRETLDERTADPRARDGFAFTAYFESVVLRKRPYLSRELCIRVIGCACRSEVQPDLRVRFWAIIDELGGRAVRVVTLPDRRTIHNAFIDRGFRP